MSQQNSSRQSVKLTAQAVVRFFFFSFLSKSGVAETIHLHIYPFGKQEALSLYLPILITIREKKRHMSAQAKREKRKAINLEASSVTATFIYRLVFIWHCIDTGEFFSFSFLAQTHAGILSAIDLSFFLLLFSFVRFGWKQSAVDFIVWGSHLRSRCTSDSI